MHLSKRAAKQEVADRACWWYFYGAHIGAAWAEKCFYSWPGFFGLLCKSKYWSHVSGQLKLTRIYRTSPSNRTDFQSLNKLRKSADGAMKSSKEAQGGHADQNSDKDLGLMLFRVSMSGLIKFAATKGQGARS
jgi:hypothetical protein